jgi:hypothetical protein
MFIGLPDDIINLIESFQKISYWKNRFTQDVLPQLNKGWRLVRVSTYNNNKLCKNCYYEGYYLDCHDHHTQMIDYRSQRTLNGSTLDNTLHWLCFDDYKANTIDSIFTYEQFIYTKLRPYYSYTLPEKYMHGGFLKILSNEIKMNRVYIHTLLNYI